MLLLPVALEARDVRQEIIDNRKTADPTLTASAPPIATAAHTRGNIALVIRNNGTFGAEEAAVWDPLSAQFLRACIYPKNSNLLYLWVASLWVGAVVGHDTLVSCGAEDWYCTYEFWPDRPPFGEMTFQSIDVSSPYYSEDAYSEQDIICNYTDTITDYNITNSSYCDEITRHQPLYIKATQRSMAWSYDYADDFVLFDYQVENIGRQRLEEVYMSLWLDPCIFHLNNEEGEYWHDDIVGFYRTHPSEDPCGYLDTINVTFHADNDGDPVDGDWNFESPLSAVGVRVVRTPSDSLKYSFNWWIMDYNDPSYDFGPRQKGTVDDPFREFGDRLGTPLGDENKYYVMKHDEFDYDLMYTAIDHSDSGRGWLPPPEHAVDIADGYDLRYMLSFGPFDIDPGEKLPISFAWVGGEDFHVNPDDYAAFSPYNPDVYYNLLDFSSLAENSKWASWIYDNPGVDTDGDGDSGKFRVCCPDTIVTGDGLELASCDTTWYEGDGIPDFRGASPPPAPRLRLEPAVGSFRVRFNGLESETSRDRFSGECDFEGYRVYLGRDDRISSFSMVASYDREDYNKFVYDVARQEFRLLDIPFSREQLQQLYGDPVGDDDFDPLEYGRDDIYIHPLYPDSMFYFTAQDFNQSIPGDNTPITRVYPDQPYPTTLDPSLAQPDELTEEGLFKYFEYELTIEDILPTVPYYVSITAFDFGSPKVGLSSLESSILNNCVMGYPLTEAEVVEAQNLKVYVYPNPYRVDADYERQGFENRSGTLSKDRMRRIHFANLPCVCRISIYSIDGDLVREIEHNYPAGGPEAMHDTWDLVTRNTQAAVSGIYYWVVESDTGTQMGKLVIIK